MNRKTIRKKSTQSKKREIIGVLLLLLGLLILLSLLSYHPQDWPNSNSRQMAHNWMGLIGAAIAHYLILYGIGYPILVLPVLILIYGWFFLAGRSTESLTAPSLLFLFYATTISVAIALQNQGGAHYAWSGLVGYFFASVLLRYFGNIGSVLILLTAVVLPLLYVTDFSLARFLSFFSGTFQKTAAAWANYWSDKKRQFELKRELKRKEKEERRRQEALLEEEWEEEEEEEEPAVLPPESKPEEVPKAPEVLRSEMDSEKAGEQLDLPLKGEEEPPPAEEEPQAQKAIAVEREEVPEFPTDYNLPLVELLDETPPPESRERRDYLMAMSRNLEQKLGVYGVRGKVVQIHPGPVITQFEVAPDPGVKISKFQAIADDLAMVLEARSIRIVAPIPGKSVVGIEIPNRQPALVSLRRIVESPDFANTRARLPLGLGVDITGEVYVADLAKMPHLLVAGSTGSGKSVGLNVMICSLLFKFSPEQVRFVLIDPKRLELLPYARLVNHHLITLPNLDEHVITAPENAVMILKAIEMEMEHRYRVLAKANVRNLEDFNTAVEAGEVLTKLEERYRRRMPYIVIVVDELADLMLTAGKEIEAPISRLAHMARAVGIHMILATQRPSTDVLTGVIKANFPSRIAFRVASGTDSRVVLDSKGAERLLGRGDMLFLPPGQAEPVRLHSAYVSAREVGRVLEFVENQPKFPQYELTLKPVAVLGSAEPGVEQALTRDELFNEALKLVVLHQQGSISLLQRRLRIGYARAARLIDQMEQAGFVGPFDGSKAREVLIGKDELQSMGLL